MTVRSVDRVSAFRTLRSHQRVGIAAATGEQDKLRHYGETLCNQTQALVCLAVESHGRWGKQLKRLVTQYGAHSVTVHGQGSPADRASMQAGKEVRVSVGRGTVGTAAARYKPAGCVKLSSPA